MNGGVDRGTCSTSTVNALVSLFANTDDGAGLPAFAGQDSVGVRILDATGATVADNNGSITYLQTITNEPWPLQLGRYSGQVGTPTRRPFILQLIDTPLHTVATAGVPRGPILSQIVFDPVADAGLASCASLPLAGIAAPTITGISPSGGPVGGGTAVTITGTNLLGVTSLRIGGTNTTPFTVVNATTITATTPAHAAASVDVSVTNFGGIGTGSGLFTYTTAASPTIAAVTPSSGPTTGGTVITITGTNLSGPTGVTIGGVAATGVSVNAGGTQIVATTPAGAVGGASVVVTTANGSNPSNALFTYAAATAPATPPATTATGSAELRLVGSTSPTLFSAVGQSITYAFTVSNAGRGVATDVAVTDSRLGAVMCAATTLAAGASTACTASTTTTAADVRATVIASTARARGSSSGTSVESPAVTLEVKLDIEAVRRATRSAIQGFMSRRADLIASTGPDTDRSHQRLTTPLFGGAAAPAQAEAPAGLGGPRGAESAAARPMMVGGRSAGMASSVATSMARDQALMTRGGTDDTAPRSAVSPFGFAGAADDETGRFVFSASLSSMRAAAASEQARKEAAGMAYGAMRLTPATASRQPSRFDVWLEGAYTYYKYDRGSGARDGHAGLFFAGADYLVMPGLLLGAMVQIDSVSEVSSTLVGNADGFGWMAGPYVSVRLTQSLYFDARSLWGRSRDHVDPLGAFSDSYDSSRWLTGAKLTGQWLFGSLTFKPSAELIYVEQTQEAYTDAIGIAIDGQTVHLGRLSVGPEFSYRMPTGQGGAFQPFVGVKGVWDFSRTAETPLAGEPVGQSSWHGRVEAGGTLVSTSGLSLRATGAYDGLGDSSFSAWQARASLIVPLQ